MRFKLKNKPLYNVIISSVGFCILQIPTVVTVQSLVFITNDIMKDNPSYQVNVYIGLSISFLTTSICNWFIPAIISVLGPRMTIFVGFLVNITFFLQFKFESSWCYYVESMLHGMFQAFCWTGQANYLALNSRTEEMTKNSGIFWTFLNSGAILGNVLYLICLKIDYMGRTKRLYFILILTAFNGLACLMVLFYRKCEYERAQEKISKKIMDAIRLYIKKDMLIIYSTLFYSGLESSLCIGVYSNTVANIKTFTQMESTTIIATSALLTAFGETAGGIFFGILGHKIKILGHYSIICIGFVLHLFSYISIILTIPKVAVKIATEDRALVNNSLTLALTCSLFLGLGDAAFVTQCYSLLAQVIVDKSDVAFSILNCLRCLGFGIGYFLTLFDLYIYISIVIVFDMLALICFILFEKKSMYEPTVDQIPVNEKGERINVNQTRLLRRRQFVNYRVNKSSL